METYFPSTSKYRTGSPELEEAWAVHKEYLVGWRERNPVIKSTPEWIAAADAACKHDPRIHRGMLDAYAGSIQGDEAELCDTFEVALRWYRLDNNLPEPESTKRAQESIARSMERDAKQRAKAEYTEAFNQWVAECQERNARHTQARREHADRMAESKRILDMQTSDPAPVQPVKRQ